MVIAACHRMYPRLVWRGVPPIFTRIWTSQHLMSGRTVCAMRRPIQSEATGSPSAPFQHFPKDDVHKPNAVGSLMQKSDSTIAQSSRTEPDGSNDPITDSSQPAAMSQGSEVGGEMPVPPIPSACCMSGCPNCVWVEYAEELSRYAKDGGEEAWRVIQREVEDPTLLMFLRMELKK